MLAIRQSSYPASLRELDAWYTHVPDSQNAALILTKAFSDPGFANNSSTMTVIADNTRVPTRSHLLDQETKAELTAVLATNQSLLDLIHSAAALTNSRYPIDLTHGFQTLMPHLSKVKAAIQLLTAEALLDASSGETERGMSALRAAGSVADSVSEEPFLISQLVRISN